MVVMTELSSWLDTQVKDYDCSRMAKVVSLRFVLVAYSPPIKRPRVVEFDCEEVGRCGVKQADGSLRWDICPAYREFG